MKTEVVTIDDVGIIDLGMGAVILKTNDGKEFPISAFSDVAKHISDFHRTNVVMFHKCMI